MDIKKDIIRRTLGLLNDKIAGVIQYDKLLINPAIINKTKAELASR